MRFSVVNETELSEIELNQIWVKFSNSVCKDNSGQNGKAAVTENILGKL